MARLERKSLSQQLAKAVGEDIAAGVWKDRLPGYRLLGERYDVSRRDCENAMRILEADGVIGPAQAGKMRSILLKKVRRKEREKSHLLIVIDSFHPPTPSDAELISRIEGFWKGRGGEVSRVECDLMRCRKPDFQMKKWVEMTGADCLLFETIMLDWIRPLEKLGLSCYALGGQIADSSGVLSGSCFLIVEFIKKLLREVLELGHRRILLVLARATPEERMRHFLEEETASLLEGDWGDEKVAFSVMIPDLVNPSDWQDWWKETLVRERPTVVITESVFQAICIHNLTLLQGLQMPIDMSLVVLEDAEFLEWLNPPPTRYRCQQEKAFRHFRSWVRSGFAQGSLKFLGAELVGGGTLGSPPVSEG